MLHACMIALVSNSMHQVTHWMHDARNYVQFDASEPFVVVAVFFPISFSD